MTTWHQRLFPYPLLAPWTQDYVGASFGVDVPEAVLNNGREIKLEVVFRICSDTLSSLIKNERASYAVEVSCPRTFARSTHLTPAESQLLLDARDFDEEILLTPYVVSTDAIEGFSSPEHASEWSEHRPGGFSVPVSGILAVGNNMRVILRESGVSSVIDLIANPSVAEGTFDVQLDDERVKIHVPVTDKERIEAVRTRRGSSVEFAALFPGLYLHAVAEALRNMSDYENTRWAFTVRSALERSGNGAVDAELLRSDALRYAQEIMEQPIGVFLTAAMSSDEGV